MIECIECGFIGNPKPLTEAESTYGFSQVCPNCSSVNINFNSAEQSLINLKPKPTIIEFIDPLTV